jgi:glutathione-independent formaldehyde dehydrogenase
MTTAGSSAVRRNLSLVYAGPEKIQMVDTGYPKMVDPKGQPMPHAVIIQLIASNICGSDLHMYRGRTSFPVGSVFGHEQTGKVVEVGPEVHKVKVGDWVSIPSNVSCGTCVHCKERKTNLCLDVNEKKLGGAYGYPEMGGWRGGQSEYNVIPYADWQCLVLPQTECADRLLDVAMLADTLPTGFNAAVQAGVQVARTVYVAGAGPVGICCAASCILLGAAVVIVGDPNAARLRNVQKLGSVIRTLDVSKLDANDPEALNHALKKLTGRSVVDCACDCVGYEAYGLGSQKGENKQEAVLHSCFQAVKSGGQVGIPGAYFVEDAKGSTEALKHGILPLQYGEAWMKGLEIKGGYCPVMRWHRDLLISIVHGRLSVSDALNVQVITLEQAAEAYKIFSRGEAVKFVIDPCGLLRQLSKQRVSPFEQKQQE